MSMSRGLLSFGVVAALAVPTGCRLDPETVRELIESPTGTVSKAAMARVASGVVVSDVATTSEKAAFTFKNLLAGDPDKFDVADAFCVGSLAADTVDFADCLPGEDCDAELVIDSCLLRVGEADDNAKGRIRFKLKNSVTDTLQKTEASIEFEDFEATREDGSTTDLFKGLIAVESNVFEDDEELATETILTSDVEAIVRRVERDWFFDDGIEEYQHAIAGLRATTRVGASDADGMLEILTFVDEDGGRDEAVVLRVSASGYEVDADAIAATVNVEVQGANGTFSCNFDQLDVSTDSEGIFVRTDGACTDADGKDFSFSGEVLER